MDEVRQVLSEKPFLVIIGFRKSIPPLLLGLAKLVNPGRGVSKSGELGKWGGGESAGCDVVGLSVADRTSLRALPLPHASELPVSSIFKL